MAISAEQALERLKEGNAAYLKTSANPADTSSELVERLAVEGQSPYACIVSCADSRVVPEHIFTAGLGELFCIRVAGNVVGAMELASCVYAAEHLGAKLIVVLGHTKCGAVGSALEQRKAGSTEGAHEATGAGSALTPLLSAVSEAIGDERDPRAASIANARAGAAAVLADVDIAHLVESAGLVVVPALYLTETGEVEWL